MLKTDGSRAELPRLLGQLIELESEAVEANLGTLTRLNAQRVRREVEAFVADHRRHVEALSRRAHELGVGPPKAWSAEVPPQSGTSFTGTFASDRVLFSVLRTSAAHVYAAYERALQRDDLPADLRDLFARHASDERRQRDWFDAELAELDAALPQV